MPSTLGMKAGGFYDRYASVPRATYDVVAHWIPDAVASLALPEPLAPIVVADYGCSEGRNSIVAVGHVIESLRQRRAEQAIVALHGDLPSNNFNQLFANLHDPTQSNYLQDKGVHRPNISSLAFAGSVYGPPLLPVGSVHFALSMLVVEWLDRVPDATVPDFLSYQRGPAAAEEAFRRQAERDLAIFYERRAAELAPGGKLMVVIPGQSGTRRCSDGIYDVLHEACLDLIQSGHIDRGRYERFLMPVYFRTIEEMVVPLQRGDLFRVDRAETLIVPTPFEEQYREDRNAAAYASAYANFIRAISEPVTVATLAEPPQRAELGERIYRRVEERLQAEPERYPMVNIEVGVLLTRL